jgi:CRISPR/Cas system-associated exonuclease Cas4 (RecB family)
VTLSGSAVPRALRCIGSVVLPQSDYRTTYAEDGADNHAEMEAAADVGDIDSLPPVVRELIRPDDVLITETSFAYDVSDDTARKLGGPRAYAGLRPFEIPSTPDLAIHGDGRLVVVDYKNFEEVDPADENAQVATYALTLCRVLGYDEATVVIVYLGGLLRPSIATLTALDLDAHAARLRDLHSAAATARARFRDGIVPPLATGKHCKYCSAFIAKTSDGLSLCPEWAKLKQESVAVLPLQVETMIPFGSDEDAAEAFDLLQRIKLLTTRIQAALYARAAERPIPLADGRMFGPVEKQGKREIDADKAYEKIRAKYGQHVADASVQRKVAQKWIEDALKANGVKGATKAKEELVKELEAEGAVTRETKTTIEIYEPQKLLKVVG